MLEPRVDIYTAWIQDAKSNSNMIEKDHATTRHFKITRFGEKEWNSSIGIQESE